MFLFLPTFSLPSKQPSTAGPIIRGRLPLPDDVAPLLRVVSGKRRRVLRGGQLDDVAHRVAKPVAVARRGVRRFSEE